MHSPKTLLAAVCAILLISSCIKDSTVTNVPIITGIQTTDFNAEPTGVVGIDNSKAYTTNFNDKIIVYPNPCVNIFSIVYFSPYDDSMKIWMEAGLFKNPPSGASVKNQSLYGKTLNPLTIKLNTGENSVSINATSFPNGFYRVYVATMRDTLYENIWIKR